VNDAIVFRMNPWLLVALVAALVLVAAAILVATQPGLLHTLGTALHGPAQPAFWCGVSGGGCP